MRILYRTCRAAPPSCSRVAPDLISSAATTAQYATPRCHLLPNGSRLAKARAGAVVHDEPRAASRTDSRRRQLEIQCRQAKDSLID